MTTKPYRWTANRVELLVAEHFGTRANIIVPNVFWGWGLRYEADMVILRPSGVCIEVEIKVAAADIKADLKKYRAHDSDRFRMLYFAVPAELKDHAGIPERAGIITVERVTRETYHGQSYTRDEVKLHRAPRVNKKAERINDVWKMKLLQLAHMRVWSLKKHFMIEQMNRMNGKGLT